MNLLVFVLAAALEIAGCFMFWMWLRRDAALWTVALGVGSLLGFATVLTKSEATFAGRAYAAYGGVYVASLLLWLWLVEGQRPSLRDVIGATISIAGALVIVSAGSRGR